MGCKNCAQRNYDFVMHLYNRIMILVYNFCIPYYVVELPFPGASWCREKMHNDKIFNKSLVNFVFPNKAAPYPKIKSWKSFFFKKKGLL